MPIAMDLTPKFNPDWIEHIKAFLDNYLKQAKADGFAFGISGGIDSAVVAKLCSEAVEAKNVTAFMLPDAVTPVDDVIDSEKLAKSLGIRFAKMGINKIMASFEESCEFMNSKEILGNTKPRVRMAIMYAYAKYKNYLVVGTSNKSELLTGYFTKFGDGGADLEPIGDLYKTQVRALAKELKLPQKFLMKAPSAGLWHGQTDEGELGIAYSDLDKILYGIELGLDDAHISELSGSSLSKVRYVRNMVHNSIHKRIFPRVPKLGARTVGIDWREI